MRPTKDEYYLEIAKAVSLRSTCLKKHYGAIIVKDDQLIASGFNGSVRGEPHCATCTKCDHGKDLTTYLTCQSVHAEMNCIISAARSEMLGADLYLSGYDAISGEDLIEASPCEVCLRLIKNAGINKVINGTGIIYQRNANGILERVNANPTATDIN